MRADLGPMALCVAAAAAAASAVLTWAWIRLARAGSIEDLPGRRRLHSDPTPRGGGVAIALVLLAAFAWIAFELRSPEVAGLAIGVALFAGVGLFDDLLPVDPGLKFALQLMASAGLVFALAGTWGLPWWAYALILITCAYVVNVWNFMDGINGLVTVQSLMIAAAIALWPGQPGYLSLAGLAVTCACLGFLPFNLPTAKVFLGDTGSHVLGACLFGLLLLAWHEGHLGWLQCLTLASVILLDSGLTLVRRTLAGRTPWRAHRDHLYQYAVRSGHTHLAVCLAYAVATLAAIGVAFLGNPRFSSPLAVGLPISSFVAGALLYFQLRRHWLDLQMKRRRAHV